MTTSIHTTSERLGAFAYWPDNPFWSFQFLRLVEQAGSGGADFTEVHRVVRDLPVGDGDAWFTGFAALATGLAEEAAAAHHDTGARDLWWRAASYWRAASFFLSPRDFRHQASVHERRRCFAKAADRYADRVVAVEIPYGETHLPGYVFAPAEVRRPGPAVLLFGGADAVAEELFFHLGRSLSENGFTVLAFDGPGQGEALRRGIRARPDFEVAVAAALDFLETVDGVDPQAMTLVGQSLGGLYAARAAAFEPRLRGVVVWGALYDLQATVSEHAARAGGTGGHYLEQYREILGLESVYEVLPALAAYSLHDVADRIRMPLLVLHGEDDMLCAVSDAHRLHAEARSQLNDLRIYASGEPGCTHCQVDALPLVQHDIIEWLGGITPTAAERPHPAK